nr:MAG TPA: hypothetical protein [Caudoviricetes sp.]
MLYRFYIGQICTFYYMGLSIKTNRINFLTRKSRKLNHKINYICIGMDAYDWRQKQDRPTKSCPYFFSSSIE